MSERSIKLAALGNIIYSRTIELDDAKVDEISKCVNELKHKLRLLRLALIVLIVSLIVLSFYLYLQDSMYSAFINFLVVYFIFVFVGMLVFRIKMLVPFRYSVFVHEVPGRAKEKSIVVVSEYVPKGREVFIVPMRIVSKVGIIETEKRIACKDRPLRGLEIFITDKKGKEIAKFGFLGKENIVKEVAMDLWSFVVEKENKDIGSDKSS